METKFDDNLTAEFLSIEWRTFIASSSAFRKENKTETKNDSHTDVRRKSTYCPSKYYVRV